MILESGNERKHAGHPETALHQVLTQLPGPAAVVNSTDGSFYMINPIFEELLGSNALYRPLYSLWPEGAERLQNKFMRVTETGIPVHDHEILFKTSVNVQTVSRWFDFLYSPYNLEGTTAILVHGFEVTNRVKSREQLAEQQLLLKNITDAAAAALWMIDINGEVTFVNQAWVDWTGRPAEAHLGRGWLECVVGVDREHVISRFIRGFNAREQFEVDFRIRRKDGSLQWIAATGKPRYLSDGAFAGYVGSCMDITQRKESERLLKESEERFRRIADSASVFIWMCDAEGNSTFYNKSWLQFTGDTLAKLIGKVKPEGIHPDDEAQIIHTFREAFENYSGFQLEFRLKRYDDVYRWIGMKFVPRYTGDAFEGFIGSGMDITEAKEHEQLKNEFIGMASHELKTPITSIKAYVQLLMSMYKNETDDEFLRKSLGTVNKQINKLTRLITDLLDISKIESGRLSLNSETFVLNELIRESIDEVHHTAVHHDIVFNEPGQFRVNADRDRIAQVITNFLTNAIKYSPEADRIDVFISNVDGEVLVKVTDYGIGIDIAEQQKVFNRFYRVEGRNEQTFSGFGIGLYVAAEIVKRHNGRIWVESEKDKGSSFSFALPAAM